MTIPTWTVGDTARDLSGRVTSTVGTVTSSVDLSSATTVEAHIARPDHTIITRDATHTGTDGSWSVPWSTGDLTMKGTYEVEIQVTWGDGKIETFAGAYIGVRKQIA